ncbi:MAG: hypothetical protein JRN37_06005 [Nitrososphaerota archaeon]|nr:hypothetical protein [Nitrososphaerota archaeon]
MFEQIVELCGQARLMTADAAFISEKGELLGRDDGRSPSQDIPKRVCHTGAGCLDGDEFAFNTLMEKYLRRSIVETVKSTLKGSMP